MKSRLGILLALAVVVAVLASPARSATVTDWLRVVADGQLAAHPKPRWDWGEGTMLQGMLAAGWATCDRRYLDYVCTYLDETIQRGFKVDHGDRCLPGLSAVTLYATTRERSYLNAARQCVDFLLNTPTNEAPIWSRYWVDDLYMVTPLLAGYGNQVHDKSLVNLAPEQIQRYAERLVNPDTGLFHHAWSPRTKERSACAWARGNGWAAMALVEVLARLPVDHPKRRVLIGLLRRQAAQLKMLQDPSGLWHTVVDHPETYLETSASAMIGYAFAYGAHRGNLDAAYLQPARAALAALVTKVNDKGRLTGASVGTGPGAVASYQRIPTGVTDWGTGAFLLLAAQLANDRRANLMVAGAKLPPFGAGSPQAPRCRGSSLVTGHPRNQIVR